MKHISWLKQLGRVLVFFIGVFLIAIGMAVSIHADLGTAPIASLPTVLSFATPVSVGTYVMSFNMLFFVLQVLILRRKFKAFQLIQVPLTIVFGLLVDVSMYLTAWIDPASYLEQWFWLLVSVVVLALGIYVEMQPRLTFLPANGIVFVLYTVLQNIPYSRIKIIFDTTIVVISAILSLVLLGGLQGVREGTVFSAFAVGIVIRYISRFHKRLRGESPEAEQ